MVSRAMAWGDMRKRCHRRQRQAELPVVWAYPKRVVVEAMLQIRSAVSSLSGGSGGPYDIAVLLRASRYCDAMLSGDGARLWDEDDLVKAKSVVRDGMAALADAALRNGAGPSRLTTDEISKVENLADVYDALSQSTTRRETLAAFARMNAQEDSP